MIPHFLWHSIGVGNGEVEEIRVHAWLARWLGTLYYIEFAYTGRLRAYNWKHDTCMKPFQLNSYTI